MGAAITKGDIKLSNVCIPHIQSIINKLEIMGCNIRVDKNEVWLTNSKTLKGIDLITEPYPGYPTDMQSQMMALFCTCNTKSKIIENLFEARFKPAYELIKMGADIKVIENRAYISPVKTLVGTKVKATDLRGGAALVLAGLIAEGCTVVEDIQYVKRGYQNIVSDLSTLGADIQEKG